MSSCYPQHIPTIYIPYPQHIVPHRIYTPQHINVLHNIPPQYIIGCSGMDTPTTYNMVVLLSRGDLFCASIIYCGEHVIYCGEQGVYVVENTLWICCGWYVVDNIKSICCGEHVCYPQHIHVVLHNI